MNTQLIKIEEVPIPAEPVDEELETLVQMLESIGRNSNLSQRQAAEFSRLYRIKVGG